MNQTVGIFSIIFRLPEKRDPLLADMSLEELYRMLQVVDMADGKTPMSASDREIRKLNKLLKAISY